MISSISWVPKGLSNPVAELPSKEEVEEIIKKARVEETVSGSEEDDEERDVDMDVEEVSNHDKPSDEVANALAVAKALGTGTSHSKSIGFDDISLGLRELDMEHYDNEEDEGVELFSSKVGGDLYYPSNDLDPYLKKNKNSNDNDDEDEADDSEELEDMAINPTDSVIVCARNEDDVSHLEVWVYEESNDGEDPNMYVHHDLIIPAFPLSTAWLDCPLKGGERGNFIAVGSMEPSIEIWDLDVIEEVEPCMVLGGIAEKKKKKKKGKTSVKYKESSHTDAVLGLAWNKEYRNILASASADKKVKIWDLATGKCEITMDHHSDKVQAVAWNQHSPRVLLSGSFDRSLVMKDGRADQSLHSGYKWLVSADVEGLAWDPHAEHMFVASLEDGTVQGFDVRAATSGHSGSALKACFTIHAHEKAVCSVCYNPSMPNILATGSTDKMVKLWDLSNNQPSCVSSRNPKAGAIFSVSFSDDCPFLLAIGGSKGVLQVWNTISDAGIAGKFGKYRKNPKIN